MLALAVLLLAGLAAAQERPKIPGTFEALVSLCQSLNFCFSGELFLYGGKAAA